MEVFSGLFHCSNRYRKYLVETPIKGHIEGKEGGKKNEKSAKKTYQYRMKTNKKEKKNQRTKKKKKRIVRCHGVVGLLFDVRYFIKTHLGAKFVQFGLGLIIGVHTMFSLLIEKCCFKLDQVRFAFYQLQEDQQSKTKKGSKVNTIRANKRKKKKRHVFNLIELSKHYKFPSHTGYPSFIHVSN